MRILSLMDQWLEVCCMCNENNSFVYGILKFEIVLVKL